MKKTYWWRWVALLVVLVILLASFMGPCDFRLSKCLYGNSIYLTRTLFHYFLAVLVTLPLLFFISDKIFKIWLYVAFCWIVLMFTFVPLVPEYSGGWGLNYDPSREIISIWMAKIFVIISLVLIIWQSIKERKK